MNCLLHQRLYIFQFTCLKLIINSYVKQKNALCKSPLTSLCYDLYCLGQPKNPENTSRPQHSKLKKIQGLAQKFKDFSRTLHEIQRLFQTVRTPSASPVSIEEDEATSFSGSLSRFLPREGMPVHDRFTPPSAVCHTRYPFISCANRA